MIFTRKSVKKTKSALRKHIHQFSRTHRNALMVMAVFFHYLFTKEYPPQFVSVLFAFLSVFMFSKFSFTVKNFFIPLFLYLFMFYTISSGTFTFLHRCFIMMLCEDIKYEFSIGSRRKYFLLLLYIYFMLSNHFNLQQIAFIAAAMTMSLIIGIFMNVKNSKYLRICWDPFSLFIATAIQLFSLTRVSIDVLFLSLLSLLNIKISFLPEMHVSSESKRLLSFFTVNFLFMFVEFWVGYSTNSLGLLSDAFHMMSDNTSLFFSSLASILASQGQTKTFPYGLNQIENVCSFSNTILLFFISFNLLSESISRIVEPPSIGEENLLTVSILGLLVNLLGLFFTDTGDKSDTFMRSIYLHIFVDAMGSVAVIISSLCIIYTGTYVCDPICSFLIAVSILYSTIPLVKGVVSVLMLKFDRNEEMDIRSHIQTFGTIVQCDFWLIDKDHRFMNATVRQNEIKNDKNSQTNLSHILDILKENKVQPTIEFV